MLGRRSPWLNRLREAHSDGQTSAALGGRETILGSRWGEEGTAAPAGGPCENRWEGNLALPAAKKGEKVTALE